MARTRRKRSRYSGSCLRRSCCSTWSVNITFDAIAAQGREARSLELRRRTAPRGATGGGQWQAPAGSNRLERAAKLGYWKVAVEGRGAWRALVACAITIVLAAGSRTSPAAFLRPIE